MALPTGTRRLIAALIVSMGAGLDEPAVSGAEPARDNVTGSGSTAFYKSFAFDITSGPSGERPRGSTTVTTNAGPLTLTWTGVTCLSVQGNRATFVGPLAPNDFDIGYGKLTVEDNGPAGSGLDTLRIDGAPVGAPAPTCAILPSGSEQLLTGDIVVADAFPSRRQARRACLAERRRIGRLAFRLKYGEGSLQRHALRRCVGRSAPPG